MADKDTSTKDNTSDNSEESVETKAVKALEDETLDNENQEESNDDTESNEDDSDESGEEDESDESDDDSEEDETKEEEDEDEFTKAFSQIKGDTYKEYVPNLEEAYRKSSAEGKRLSTQKQELQDRIDIITQAVANNPTLAKAITDATKEGSIAPTVDPALQELREQREQEMTKSYEDFVGNHPELEEDTDLQQELLDNLSLIGAQSRKVGKTVKMADALKKAWVLMGKNDDSKEKLVNAAKDSASKPKTSATKKTKSSDKQSLTPEQISYGKKMGLTEKQMLEHIK